MPTGCLGPYRASSVRPATMVGSANGRSISAFTTPLPRKSSRTSTHAISVPVTALIATTMSEVIRVSLNAAIDCGVVTTSKNLPNPPSRDLTATAASGSSTITDRYVIATPRPSAAPLGSGAARGPAGRGPAVSSLGGGDTEALLDGGHDAVVGVEEPLRDRAPAAELLDREEVLRHRELVRPRRALHDRPVALRGEDPLRLRRVEELHEVLRLAARVLRDRDRVLDQDRLRRDRVVELLAGLLSGDRLVLVRDQHVPLAAREGAECVARALVLYGLVLEQLAQEVGHLRLGRALHGLAHECCHHVPAHPARGEGVRRDHLSARL